MENYLDQIKNIFLRSNKNKVAIIGKGGSINEIDLRKVREEHFVIALNDADAFLHADASVLYRENLVPFLSASDFNSGVYLAPKGLGLPKNKHIPVEYLSLDQEGLERIYSYFYTEDFYILDFTLLSAMKLALLFQKVKEVAIEVCFLGFDFYLETVDKDDFQGLEYRNAHLRTQESIFISLLKDLSEKNPLLHFQHIGYKKYSTLSPGDFNAKLNEKLSIEELPSNTEVYKGLINKLKCSNHVIVVAEFTNNHIGSKSRLLKMIELAAEAGADMIKVQKRDVDSFYSKEELNSPYSSPFGRTLRDYRLAVELSDELFTLLDIECRRRNIPWFASVLDWKSYLYMKELDCPLIKLPSTISNHKNYLQKVAKDFSGELVVSTGFTDQSYEEFVLNKLVSDKMFFLLQCTSSYPTPPEGCQVSVVRHYDQLRVKYPNIIPGYSSHDLGSLASVMAVAAGARMVEKHVKLGDLEWVHFDSVAIDLYDGKFKSFVKDIRKAEVMCGSKIKQIFDFEHHKYRENTNEN